mmetsp:Transcript_28112/g.34219  ORF Transcript_28112/g.34219 Transcript_28112/m.34219 type:complete len:229 (-) Transcript_28112:6-692(-)
MLEMTSKINRFYARRFHHDFVIARGIYFQNVFHVRSRRRQTPASRASYNKIAVLRYALEKKYDRVLLLDADAVIVDFDRDVSAAYDMSTTALMAQRVVAEDEARTWNVNDGVTFWNLKHGKTRWLVEEWERRCLYRIVWMMKDSDQRALHGLLKVLRPEERPVNATLDDFSYAEGTFVKHFMRPSDASWDEAGYNVSTRLGLIKDLAAEICDRHELFCDDGDDVSGLQ